MNEKLKRYFDAIAKINGGLDVNDDDLAFVMEYSPEIDQTKIDEYLKNTKEASPETVKAALIQVGRQLQSNPVYKEKLLKIATDQKAGEKASRISEGINLVLAGTDIANSISQIRASKSAERKSTKPGRPAIPQRDVRLQQALRTAQEGTFDQERAIAPVRAEIQDQYQADLANAKTAATGQAGAFGSYAQLAADRRNRAALNLAPIQDQIRAREQQNYQNLLGQQMGETQQRFQNQADLYGQDLGQYNMDQQAIAGLGSQGRSNLRNSLYNLGGQVGNFAGGNYGRSTYNRLRNQAAATLGNDAADMVVNGRKNLEGFYGSMGGDDTPEYWNQAYTDK